MNKQFLKENKWYLMSLACNATFAILLGREAIQDAIKLSKSLGGK